jgi:hypothetical protein
VAFLIVGKWETLRNYWDRLTTFSTSEASRAVSRDTEYFCPMDPGVISDWPAKCPVCNMALVRRKKGGAVQLPDGVVSRMQYSPYRLQLAGVRTSAVSFQPLARQVVALGNLESDETSLYVDLDLPRADAPFIASGQTAAVTSPARPGQGPWPARVRDIQFESPSPIGAIKVRIDLVDHPDELLPGMEVSACVDVPIADLEPFRSQPSGPEPLAEGEPRRVFVCPDHAGVIALSSGNCPHDGRELLEQELADNQRLGYWCPMHPHVISAEASQHCDACGGMQLVPRVLSFRPPGQVLAAPETAVIDTGERQVVYVDRGEGMFDGVEVVAGPCVDGYYAIVSGLSPGERVASAGAFLLDAETRLHANIASAYFGATTNPSSGLDSRQPAAQLQANTDEQAAKEIDAALGQLSPQDQRLARSQRICPVTKLPLGSMGIPEKLVVDGRTVFICCEGCADPLRAEPEKQLPAASSPGDTE